MTMSEKSRPGPLEGRLSDSVGGGGGGIDGVLGAGPVAGSSGKPGELFSYSNWTLPDEQTLAIWGSRGFGGVGGNAQYPPPNVTGGWISLSEHEKLLRASNEGKLALMEEAGSLRAAAELLMKALKLRGESALLRAASDRKLADAVRREENAKMLISQIKLRKG